MPANGIVISFAANKPVPKFEIAFGFAQWARYRIFLWDADGTHPKLVGEGLNSDQIPDVFDLGSSVKALSGRILTWDAAMAPLGNSPAEMFSIMVRVSQDGTVVANGLIVDTGPLKQGTIWHDMARLAVA